MKKQYIRTLLLIAIAFGTVSGHAENWLSVYPSGTEYINFCASKVILAYRTSVGTSRGDERYNLAFDFNKDGAITPADTNILRQKLLQCPATFCDVVRQFPLGASMGDSNYNPALDLNGTRVLDAEDKALALDAATFLCP